MTGSAGGRRERRHDTDLTLRWVDQGTRLLVDLVAGLDDEDLAAPSLLPGWSRAHVVAHVARNAEALVRLAGWARTGDEDPMYASAEQRDAEIASTATEPPAELRHLLAATAAELDQAFEAMGEQGRQATVRTRQGRPIRGSVLPWLRVREVWLHAVDLRPEGVEVLAAAPAGLVDELVADVTTTLARDPACPSLELRASDRDEPWQLGDGAPTAVSGTAAQLLLWLTGRGDGTDLQVDAPRLPAVPAWL